MMLEEEAGYNPFVEQGANGENGNEVSGQDGEQGSLGFLEGIQFFHFFSFQFIFIVISDFIQVISSHDTII